MMKCYPFLLSCGLLSIATNHTSARILDPKCAVLGEVAKDCGGSGNSPKSCCNGLSCSNDGITCDLTKEPTRHLVESNFTSNKDSCWDKGYKDYLASPEQCQRSCSLIPNCNSWAYHHDRSNKRCHFCSWTTPRADKTCNPGVVCSEWGLALKGVSPANIRDDAILVASDICTGNITPEQALSAATDLNAIIQNINQNLYASDSSFTSTHPAALTSAAAILSSENDQCFNEITGPNKPCSYAGILFLQVRGLLLHEDDNADRAFPNTRDAGRASIFNNHKVFITDNGWFSSESLSAIHYFFSQVPAHLMIEGVLWDAPFARMSANDAYRCNGDSAALSFLGFTNRGFNVFKRQIMTGSEQGFPGDTPLKPSGADGLMVVVRHETAHQFDRVQARNTRLTEMFNALKTASKGWDDNWLRSNVGDSFFQGAPQEIIASQIGNQYFQSTSAQLRLAAHRMTRGDGYVPIPTSNITDGTATLTKPDFGCDPYQGKNLGYKFSNAQACANAAMGDPACTGTELMWAPAYYASWGCRCCKAHPECSTEKSFYTANGNWDIYQYRNRLNAATCKSTNVVMGWFLFHVDQMSVPGGDTVSFYEGDVDGRAHEICVKLQRDASSRITQLDIPGCGIIGFTYDAKGIVDSVSRDAVSCIADASAASIC